MKKLFGFGILLGLIFGVNSALFAQGGQNPPPPEGQRRGGQGGMHREMGEMRERMGDGMQRRGMQRRGPGGRRGGMRGKGFGIAAGEIFKLNLTSEQKVKLFDFRKKMMTEREGMMKDHKPGEGMMKGMKPGEGMNPDEMRQLMSAKSLGTLTAEQKTKLEAMETQHKQMMEKRKTEMEAMKAKMEQAHQEFLNIFTLEQRKQLEQMRTEKAKQMQERMKQMQDGRGGGQRGPGMKKPAPPAKPIE